MVEVRSLSHRYGQRVALDGVSLRIGRGTVYGLLGPNGSGKSTLLKILATLLPATPGVVTVGGIDAGRDPAGVRAKIGVVFQSPAVDPHLSVIENLRHHGHLYGLSGRDLEQRIDLAMEQFVIVDRRMERVGKLSGGLRRRVELAKALLHRPAVLLLDEPSSGLDPATRADLLRQLRRLADQGTTVVLSTHLMDEADVCDRLAILSDGKVVVDDTPAALRARVGAAVVSVTVADPETAATRLAAATGLETRVVDRSVRIEYAGPGGRGETLAAAEGLMALVLRSGIEAESVAVSRPTLADAYISLTGKTMDAEPADRRRD